MNKHHVTTSPPPPTSGQSLGLLLALTVDTITTATSTAQTSTALTGQPIGLLSTLTYAS